MSLSKSRLRPLTGARRPRKRTAVAQVAELVDAPASGAGARKGVEVRVLSWAPSFLRGYQPQGLKPDQSVALERPCYHGMQLLPAEMRRLKQLEDENAKLRKPGDFILADEDGAIVIPAARIEEGLVEAERLIAVEVSLRQDSRSPTPWRNTATFEVRTGCARTLFRRREPAIRLRVGTASRLATTAPCPEAQRTPESRSR